MADLMQSESLSINEAEVVDIVAESDEFYHGLYPPESNHLESTDDLSQPDVVFLGCRVDGVLAACGAVKRMRDDGSYAEIKRLFVKPAFRGRGLARLLMQDLEKAASRWAVKVVRLETGTRQPEALALYRSLGYRERDAFGSYPTDPLSIFMEKTL